MAFGSGTTNDLAGAVGDILQGQATAGGLRLKARGDLAEAGNYDLAATLAGQNEQFAEQSTAVKKAQSDRQLYMSMGSTQADIAGSGFAMSGSALDLMRDSASQGALTSQVIGQQGLITEAGYTEQQQAYTNMGSAARAAAAGEEDLASQAERNGWITGGIKGAAAIATLFV